MLGYVVMASNRIKSGLQVIESHGSSASQTTPQCYTSTRYTLRPGDPPYGLRIIDFT